MTLAAAGNYFGATLRPVDGAKPVLAILYSPANGGHLELQGKARNGSYHLDVRGDRGAPLWVGSAEVFEQHARITALEDA